MSVERRSGAVLKGPTWLAGALLCSLCCVPFNVSNNNFPVFWARGSFHSLAQEQKWANP